MMPLRPAFPLALVGPGFETASIWIGGIACYHLLPRLLPGAGASLPTLAVCFALAYLTRPRAAS